jgi:hypothetical protein
MLVGAGIGNAAAAPAVTASASAVTSTSAQLNGTVNPGGLSTFWAFQYGTSTSYGQNTTPVGPLTGSSGMAVSTLITGLQPGTTYHFRLVAVQGAAGTSGEGTGYTGDDVSFKTLSSGSSSTTSKNGKKHAKASLRSHTLHVHNGSVQIPWGCSGTAGAVCKGKISLTARGKIGGKLQTASCGGGTFTASTGRHHSVRAVLGSKCVSLLKKASHHRLGASLKAVFSQGTGNLKTRVTLVG